MIPIKQCIHGVKLPDPCWECEERAQLRPVVEGPVVKKPRWEFALGLPFVLLLLAL